MYIHVHTFTYIHIHLHTFTYVLSTYAERTCIRAYILACA